ncbi:hypothetical protein G5I_11033 [Acromyrmex echinatior]|uniref:Uncharacterized protein n=1 Tax=Acromyrmex echinatior TaxID=103372 RepID=F4WYI0_ACREC|nr:hypothetical protein G5I_11033 [Acromyrmex echinatior]
MNRYGGTMISSVPEALQFIYELSNAYRQSGAFDKELQRMSSRDDQGINSFGAAYRDIEYSHSNDERHAADNILAEKAWKRITASDSILKKRAAATAIWAAMKAKNWYRFENKEEEEE